MTTEPHISGKSVLPAIKGSVASVTVFCVILIIVTFFPTQAFADGALRGAISLIVLLPVIWIIMLLYFLFLGLINCCTLKRSLVVSAFFNSLLSLLFGWFILTEAGLAAAVVSSFYLFVALVVITCTGAWVWSRTAKFI